MTILLILIKSHKNLYLTHLNVIHIWSIKSIAQIGYKPLINL